MCPPWNCQEYYISCSYVHPHLQTVICSQHQTEPISPKWAFLLDDPSSNPFYCSSALLAWSSWNELWETPQCLNTESQPTSIFKVERIMQWLLERIGQQDSSHFWTGGTKGGHVFGTQCTGLSCSMVAPMAPSSPKPDCSPLTTKLERGPVRTSHLSEWSHNE